MTAPHIHEGETRMPDADYWKTEMSITYRDIQRIKDQMRDLKEKEPYVWQHVQRNRNELNQAYESGMINNPEERERLQGNLQASTFEHDGLRREIKDLKTQEQALWDRHNEAKEEWRRLRGRP
jgi:hypothetical protein